MKQSAQKKTTQFEEGGVQVLWVTCNQFPVCLWVG